ncbi:MFS general substrate transporter [Stereum hirsutum FP-91666 SS1]|uniref:MFS general substrate transporter n=1 Tax=Stereum hirsutum (strain FP-91666) TaxID=721885 RepID=UPI000444A371|nr:MFS general substrate transporter [Stereum hirsutum FP-91666 SS1]EIM85079.1 MFS general substrate transporter [Stereum hirsutum FP-91666 SS1]
MSAKDDIKGGKSEFVGTEEVEHLEKKPSSSLGDTKEDGYLLAADVRPSAERALVRKLDMRLLPTIILIFIMNYIDRTAVTSARLKGLQQDLGMTDIQYSIILAILYASYCPMQIPSNIVTHNFIGLLLCRIFIGIPEELAFRSAILYGGLLISNAFGSGSITMFVGFCAMWLLPDYVRLAEDAGEADEDVATDSALGGFVMAIKDPKVLLLALSTCSQLLGLSFVNFFPTPPWLLATIVCCVNAWHADRTGERYFHIAVPWWGVILAYIIGVSTMVTGARYVAMFLMAMGYAGFALTLVWVSNAVPRPPAKRAAAIGIVNGFGNIGNLIGSFTWPSEWGPDYHNSMYIGIASLVFSSVLSLIVRQMLIRANHRLAQSELEDLTGAKRQRIEDAARLEGISVEEALERKRGFRYLF